MTINADMAVRFLRDLICFDTTNPPGHELPAAQYVADVLRREGFDPVILESAPGRGNVVTRLRGDGSAGALLLMSHLDVVPADPDEWDHPPFAADVVDGCIWGRGAVDTKQLTAMQLALLIALKRENVPLKRDIVLAATADEETGGEHGMAWLVQNYPEWVDCEYAINEGGGFGVEVGSRRMYLCQTGEKGVCWLKLTAKARQGMEPFHTMTTRLASSVRPLHVYPRRACLSTVLPRSSVWSVLLQQPKRDPPRFSSPLS